MATAGIEVDATVHPVMIDIQLVRNDLDGVKKALARKKVGPVDVDRLAAADQKFRELTSRRDELRGRKNELSKQFGAAKKAKDDAAAERLRHESQGLDAEERELESAAALAESERRDLLLRIPNIPADDALDGESESDNRVVRVENF